MKAVNTSIKEMLEHAGIEDVYDFPPSALECECPIVVTPGTYEQTDVLEDCEYGIVKLEVIAARETRDEALSDISEVIYALHRTDWERFNNGNIVMRRMSISGMPKNLELDGSGRCLMKAVVVVETSVF